jgi:hypothetical protein
LASDPVRVRGQFGQCIRKLLRSKASLVGFGHDLDDEWNPSGVFIGIWKSLTRNGYTDSGYKWGRVEPPSPANSPGGGMLTPSAQPMPPLCRLKAQRAGGKFGGN